MPNDNKVNEAVTKSFKFLANLQSDQSDDPNYIPENMQPFVNSFVRTGRVKFDMLDKRMRNLDKSSDDYVAANKEIERIAKSFITLKRQLDVFKRSQGDFKNLIPNINQGTKAENMHVNTVIFGEQMDDFVIGEDGRLNFGIKASPKKYYKLDTLQDDYPLVTEPFNNKSYIYKKYEETLLNKNIGVPFDEKGEYNKILYNIKQGGDSDVIGLAHTDMVGDGSVSSFADMWEQGLADENLYINPETGKRLPKDNKWMKDEANSKVLSQLLAKHITNTMGEIATPKTQPNPTNVYGDEYGDEKIVTGGEKPEVIVKGKKDKKDKTVIAPMLPEVTIEGEKETDMDKKVKEHLKQDPEKEEKISDKVKTMPPKLFSHYMKKLETINKQAEQGGKKATKFITDLPGGDYYKLLKQMKTWRKSKLTPSELLRKYSK